MVRASNKSRWLAIALILLSTACECDSLPRAFDKGLDSSQSISDETALWLLKHARARFAGTVLASQSAPAQAREPRPATVFVTLFTRGHLAARPLIGAAEGLLKAMNSALDSGASGRVSESVDPDRIQIDVQDGDLIPLNKPTGNRRVASAAELIDIGMEGIAVDTGGRRLYLLPSEIIYGAVVREAASDQPVEDLLDRAMARLGFESGAWRSPLVELHRFRTIAFVEDNSRSRGLRLTRGLVAVTDIDKARLMGAARLGGEYLVRMQRPDGSFHYSFDPLADRPASGAYNIVRHAGTAYSLFELYSATNDSRYLNAARRAVDFLKSRFHRAKSGAAIYVLDNDGKAKLGANGLALLALSRQIEFAPAQADREAARQLANLILALQRKDGSFESYYRLRGDEPQGSVSLYYPGEAILGLVSLFKIERDRRLLEAARRGARHLIESQRRAGRLPPDAWLIQALESLTGFGREPEFVEHALALAEAMMAEQYTEQRPAGYQGGFGPGIPRSTPAAARAEGLVAAYRLARSVNDRRASRIADSLRAAARFQLSQQFDADNSYFLPDPGRALGGFRAGITGTRIRIDFVQHNICALLGLARSLF